MLAHQLRRVQPAESGRAERAERADERGGWKCGLPTPSEDCRCLIQPKGSNLENFGPQGAPSSWSTNRSSEAICSCESGGKTTTRSRNRIPPGTSIKRPVLTSASTTSSASSVLESLPLSCSSFASLISRPELFHVPAEPSVATETSAGRRATPQGPFQRSTSRESGARLRSPQAHSRPSRVPARGHVQQPNREPRLVDHRVAEEERHELRGPESEARERPPLSGVSVASCPKG